MTTTIDALVEAAQAVIDRWGSPYWKDMEPTAKAINELRAALAQARAEPQDPDLTIAYMAGFEKGRDAEQSGQAEPVAVGDERSLFTSWLLTQGWVERPSERENGTYINGQVQARWHAWRARADLATPPAAPVAKLEPLSDAEVSIIRRVTRAQSCDPWADAIAFTRAIEAARNAKPRGAE